MRTKKKTPAKRGTTIHHFQTKNSGFGKSVTVNFAGGEQVFAKVPGGGEIQIVPCERGIEVTLLSGADREAVIKPQCGNVFRLVYVADKALRTRTKK